MKVQLFVVAMLEKTKDKKVISTLLYPGGFPAAISTVTGWFWAGNSNFKR